MKKTSIASLQERLAGWTHWDGAMYYLGACLGFWPEYGAPGDATGPFDPWHGVKGTIYGDGPIATALTGFLEALVKEGCLERMDPNDHRAAVLQYRWSPNYKGHADLISTLE